MIIFFSLDKVCFVLNIGSDSGFLTAFICKEKKCQQLCNAGKKGGNKETQ